MHNNEVNNIAECNLLHDIINPPRRAKNLNRHYSPILHGCMNTIRVKSNFKNFRIILDSGCSSMIVIGVLVKKLGLEKDAPMQWNTQAGNITTNLEVKIYFTLPALRLVLAQDVHFFYTRSHLSALQNCALLFSTNSQFIFIFKKCITQFSH